MSRKLIVEIIGDASSLNKALDKSTTQTKKFSTGLTSMGKAAALSAGAAGVGLLVVGLKESVDAALEAEKQHAFVKKAFENAGLSAEKYATQIDKVGKSAVQLGFDDEDAQVSLARFVAAGQKVPAAMREVAIAQDLARAKGVDLNTATTALATGLTGSLRPLKSLGIVIPPVTSHMDELRAAHVGVKGPIDAAAAAHAKYLDKLATGQSVIGATSAVVKGQGEAFAGTAAGGMEKFSVQLENLKESIGGKLLPALTTVVNFINTNWNSIGQVMTQVFNVSKIAIQNFITPFRVLWDLLHGDWSGAWNAFKAPGVAAINAVKGIMNTLVSLLRGPAAAAWQAISNAARTAWQKVTGAVSDIVGTVRGAVGRVGSAARAIGTAIVTGIVNKVKTIGGAVANAFSALYSAIVEAASLAGQDAVSIGTGIIEGIVSGLGGLIERVASAIKDKVTGAIKKAWDWLTGSPHVTAAIPLGAGIIMGVVKGIGDTASMVGKTIVQQIQAQIMAARTNLSSAFASFSSAAISAFDATHGGTTKAGDAASRQLAAMQEADTVKQLNDALAAAIAGGDQSAIDAARRAIAEHDLQVQIAEEQKKHDELVKKQKDDFEKRLAELQTQAGSAKTETQIKAIQAKIKALLKKYGITPASVEAAADWNTAQSLFVGALGDLNKSMQALTSAIQSMGGRMIGGKAAGGSIPGYGSGDIVPAWLEPGEYVVRKAMVQRYGRGFMDMVNAGRYQSGGPVDPATGVPWELPLTSAVGSGPAYEIWRQQVKVAKYNKKVARVMASRALYNPAMLPTPSSRADATIEDWMSALSTDALFTERLSALKAFVDSGDAYRGGAVSRSWLTYGVPRLSTGGTITRSGLAVVHRGETVTPAASVHGSGPLVGELHVHNEVDEAHLVSKIGRAVYMLGIPT